MRRAVMASDALPRAVASSHLPKRMKEMSMAAVSKHCWSEDAPLPPVAKASAEKPSE